MILMQWADSLCWTNQQNPHTLGGWSSLCNPMGNKMAYMAVTVLSDAWGTPTPLCFVIKRLFANIPYQQHTYLKYCVGHSTLCLACGGHQ